MNYSEVDIIVELVSDALHRYKLEESMIANGYKNKIVHIGYKCGHGNIKEEWFKDEQELQSKLNFFKTRKCPLCGSEDKLKGVVQDEW